MEAIIRTNDRTLFEALLPFLKTLNIAVEITIQPEKVLHKNRKTKVKSKQDLTEFQKLLLTGPVMNDDDYNYFKEKKLDFNKWK